MGRGTRPRSLYGDETPLAGPAQPHKYESSVREDESPSAASESDESGAEQSASLVAHRLSIRHHKSSENDDQYRFFLRRGKIRRIERQHQLGPSSQFDPAGTCSLAAVPEPVRVEAAEQLDVDALDAVADRDKIAKHADAE
ncbi:hypothetical protein [Halorientalis persicus]|uniref:hypothetical protein n=1 Tax=Halorientalis persicus TaxID=1367881 RepID=UPI000B8193D7|nr:hypothetical protein [Halorientalis persicus]